MIKYNIFIGLTRLKDQYPSTIKKEQNTKTKFYGIAKSTDIIQIVIQFLPERGTPCIHKEQGIGGQGNENLDK